MADKFRKVKHTGVIILGGIFGILDGEADGGVAGIRTGSRISDVQYTREWGEVGWGRVTRGWRGAYWRGKRESGRYARIGAGFGMPGG